MALKRGLIIVGGSVLPVCEAKSTASRSPSIVDHAHRANLAIAQKNPAEAGSEAKSTAFFNFAIAWDECDGYTSVSGARVLEQLQAQTDARIEQWRYQNPGGIAQSAPFYAWNSGLVKQLNAPRRLCTSVGVLGSALSGRLRIDAKIAQTLN
ncbi:hypothetical protein DFP72DRAFT_1045414 [Ephemerocybe angulata]|uniref:Uncharacterized protein n=1 Tax=Ephemerocybe angulata TaxID=980116 RepID=A0A8H6M941_9AGAR|nr:hypothetical protein DFP72DRAFT_1045414 [Tulosesus angulatus]